jgi:hypothetical protein
MGVAIGPFLPTAAYEKVRHVFGLYASACEVNPPNAEALDAYYVQRDALGLSLRKDDLAIPTRSIHIADFSHELGDDAYELEVIVRDAETWERFFSTR